MERKWKTHYFAGFSLHHHEQYPMEGLVHTLTGNPSEVHGRAPKVNMYRHRVNPDAPPKMLAVREMDRDVGIRYFELLKECQKQGMAVLEVPIALLQHDSSDEVRVVTRWKGGRSLEKLMKDKDLGPALKRKAAFSLIDKVAILHAMGFKHGHLRLDNAVYHRPTKSRRAVSASLVDFTRMQKLDGENVSEKVEMEKRNIIGDLADSTYYVLGHTYKLPSHQRMQVEQRIRTFEEELARRYATTFEKTAEKLEKRKTELEVRGSKTQPLPEIQLPRGRIARILDWLTRRMH